MAYISSAAAPRELAFTKPSKSAKPSKASKPSTERGWLDWLFAAISAAHMRQTEREITRYLADTGGKFTDEAEREIERRYLSNQSHW